MSIQLANRLSIALGIQLPPTLAMEYASIKNRYYGAAYTIEIDAQLTGSLQQLTQQQGVTLYTVMMAAYIAAGYGQL